MEIKNKKRISWQLASDVTGKRVLMVNYYFVGLPGEGHDWVLIDAGIPESGKKIIQEAEVLFGSNNPPKAIILTHGYFDHTGALPELLQTWPDVKVYVHKHELPYITGHAQYPSPNYLAAGGGMALMSWAHPVKSLNIGNRAEPLPDGGAIPHMSDWQYIHTPGYSPGHISLFRKKDKVLLSGDVFISTYQNTFFSVLSQKYKIYNPPAYYPVNYADVLESVKELISLEPEVAGTGHGMPVYGKELKEGLENLIRVLEKKELQRQAKVTPAPSFKSKSELEPENVIKKEHENFYKGDFLKYLAGFTGLFLISGAAVLLYRKFRSE